VFSVQLDPRWQLVRDTQDRLRIKRQLRTKNFTKVSLLLLLLTCRVTRQHQRAAKCCNVH
jgi:hypothetical protein